jgi:dTDP-4-amino-4,6-dideoxygalactose transaminase
MSLIKIPNKAIEFFKNNQDEIFKSGNLAEGPWNKRLSEKVKQISGSQNAVSVNSNGSGLVAILLIFKTYYGREDIMIQSNTMYGVKTIVGTAGYNLIDYINCNLDTLMPSYKDVKNSIENYKKDKSKLVVMLSDIGGIINPDIEKISKYLKEKNILLLEDAAHSFGSTLNGKFAGTFGDAGVYSYYSTKAIFAGEGGVAVTNNKKISDLLQDFVAYDRFKQKMPIGCNIRLSELQALMIYSVVEFYNDILLNKSKIGKAYEDVCKKNDIKFISQNKNSNNGNYYKFTIISPEIPVSEKYPKIKTTTSKVYDYALGNNKDLPSKHLCLPIWYGLDDSIIENVSKELKI